MRSAKRSLYIPRMKKDRPHKTISRPASKRKTPRPPSAPAKKRVRPRRKLAKKPADGVDLESARGAAIINFIRDLYAGMYRTTEIVAMVMNQFGISRAQSYLYFDAAKLAMKADLERSQAEHTGQVVESLMDIAQNCKAQKRYGEQMAALDRIALITGVKNPVSAQKVTILNGPAKVEDSATDAELEAILKSGEGSPTPADAEKGKAKPA